MNDRDKVHHLKNLCNTMIQTQKNSIEKAQVRDDFMSESYHHGCVTTLEAIREELSK